MAPFAKLDAPQIPDHELLRCVGKGSYGEVWLGRGLTGAYRGIKIIRRSTFDESRPFDREFEGILKFEPVSRTHPGLVAVLHVGRNLENGYFYYVMEVADDQESAQAIDPAHYIPKTLSSELARRKRLPLPEGLHISLALTSALGHLHGHGLVHRDIKPSNIIFVQGAPKFADIGLVTDISNSATYVGTAGYMPPEGPGSPTADLYSLGKVIYEMVMGKHRSQFPAMATEVEAAAGGDAPTMIGLNEIILKACDGDPRRRFPSAGEMQAALANLAPAVAPVRQTGVPLPSEQATVRIPTLPAAAPAAPCLLPRSLRLAIFYKANVHPDEAVLGLLEQQLTRAGCQVFIDKHLAIGVQWAREIETKVRESDAAIVLLSATSVQSEMILYEVETARQAAQQQDGRPRLLPVRIQLAGPLPSALAPLLDPWQHFVWEGPAHNERLVQEILRALQTSQKAVAPGPQLKLESIGGAVPLDSQFYLVRSTDQEFQNALGRRDSIVLVKGARQMGKTSLLARGLQQVRQSGAKVALTDFQKFNTAHLTSVEGFFRILGQFLADQLDLSVLPEDVWDPRRSPNTNFERFLRREVLQKISGHLVWGLDEVDRLFTCDFGSEVFGLFRSWHNERALDPSGPWSRLTLAIAYATEAHLFITDVNQSPFNVGTRLTLEDFTCEQVADLNRRYGSPLANEADLRRFFALLGGQPYLVRRGLNELAAGGVSFDDFVRHAARDEGIFGDHLRRMLVLLAKDPELATVVQGVLHGQPCANTASFYRLRSAGLMKGDAPQQIQPRCEIYAAYLKAHLG